MFKRLGAFFLDIIEVIVFAVGIFFFVYLLIMQPHKVKGQSMHPNFPDGEYLLTQKVSYYFNGPQRGDVVVLKPPANVSEDSEFIKRVIGLPGERVMVSNGKVYINGSPLIEPYLAEDLSTPAGRFLQEGVEYTVPDNKYFVMGDNRPNSSDSRYWGPITVRKDPETKSEITGKAWVVYWRQDMDFGKLGVVKNPVYPKQ